MELCFSTVAVEELQTKDSGSGGGGAGGSTDRIVIHSCLMSDWISWPLLSKGALFNLVEYSSGKIVPHLKAIVESASVELEGINDGPSNNLQAKTPSQTIKTRARGNARISFQITAAGNDYWVWHQICEERPL